MTALRAAFQPSFAILSQGALRRRRMGSNPASWMLAALAVLAMLAVGLASGHWRAAFALGAGVPVFVLALLWWSYIHAGVVAQNRSSGRRLVPGLRRRSLRAVFGSWAVLTLLFCAWFAVYAGASLTPLAVVTTLLSLVAICTLESAFGAVFLLVFTFAPLAVSSLLSRETVTQALPYVTAWTAPVVTALWVWMECRMLDRSSALALKLSVMGTPQWRPAKARATADPAGVSPGQLLLAACRLPPFRYASGMVQGALWFLVALVFFRQTIAVLISALGFHIVYAHTIRTRLLSQPHEQALVRLTPRAPSTAHFNRILGRALLQRYLMAWGVASMAAIAAIAWVAPDWSAVRHSALVLCLTLPAAVLFLGGYGDRFKRSKMALAMLGLALLFLVAFMAAGQPVPVQAAILAAVLAATAVLVTVALHTLAAAPVMYPAGRLR